MDQSAIIGGSMLLGGMLTAAILHLLQETFKPAAKPKAPLPFQPFYPEPLTGGPELWLQKQNESPILRAVMELLEEDIEKEVDDLGTIATEHLPRCAGMIEALRNLHAKVKSAVDKPLDPAGSE